MSENPISTEFKYDEGEDKIILKNTQDIEPLLKLNKQELNGDSMYGGVETKDKSMRKVASIPLIIIEKWKRELGVDVMNKDHMTKVKQLLNDPQYRYLRTHESVI
jgi:GTP-sensing pleiotropic transcriptional regulator CodY